MLHTGDVVYGTPTMQGGGSYAQNGPWFFDIYGPWLRSRRCRPRPTNTRWTATFKLS